MPGKPPLMKLPWLPDDRVSSSSGNLRWDRLSSLLHIWPDLTSGKGRREEKMQNASHIFMVPVRIQGKTKESKF